MIIICRNIPKNRLFREFSKIESKRNQFRDNIEAYSLELYPISPDYAISFSETLQNIQENSKSSSLHNSSKIDKNEPFYVHYETQSLKHGPTSLNFSMNKPYVSYLEMSSIDKEILLVGTNHNLNLSSFYTMQYLKHFKPDTCVVELCYTRLTGMYNFYETLPEKKIKKLLEKNDFPNFEGFEFIVPLIYSDFIHDGERDLQIIPGDMDYNNFDMLMKAAHSQCTCKKKASYLDMKKFELELKLINNLGRKVEDNYFEDMKYRLQNKNCIMNKINLRRELRLLDSILNYSRGTSILAVVGINHLERLGQLLEIYEKEGIGISKMNKEEMEEMMLQKMQEYTICG